MDLELKIKIAREIEEAFEVLSERYGTVFYDLPEDVLSAAARAATETIDVYLLGKKHGEEE